MEHGENIFECPYCQYLFLFPPHLDSYQCPVCAGEVIRPTEDAND